MMNRTTRLACAAAALLLPASSITVAQSPGKRPTGRVLRVEELTSAALGRIDRDRTVVLLVGGILEEHGPFIPVRAATERAVFMDLADQLGTQGFRRVFVVHGHGEPIHNRVLDQAGDYFRDMFGTGSEKRGAFTQVSRRRSVSC